MRDISQRREGRPSASWGTSVSVVGDIRQTAEGYHSGALPQEGRLTSPPQARGWARWGASLGYFGGKASLGVGIAVRGHVLPSPDFALVSATTLVPNPCIFALSR